MVTKNNEKQWFTVIIEGDVPVRASFRVDINEIVPATTEWKVQAYDEEEALNIVEKAPHHARLLNVNTNEAELKNIVFEGGKAGKYAKLLYKPQPNPAGIKKRIVSVKNMLTGMINWVKRF